ncbi:MAG: hypothetical protein ACLGSA_08410 [Acidobacteriota bacterium]
MSSGMGCRAALHRLLDPTNTAVTLTLDKVASVLGRKIRLELV